MLPLHPLQPVRRGRYEHSPTYSPRKTSRKSAFRQAHLRAAVLSPPLHSMNAPFRCPSALSLLLGLTCATTAGFSQAAIPPARTTPAEETKDSAMMLSPFVVATDRDQGYVATDTLNAGRLSTNALMTPGNFEALTRDFLNDLGIFNIDEASGWLTNARPLELGAIEGNSMNPGSLALNDSGVNVSLRGLGANPSTRNYFTSASTPKEYNVERAEAARGPNAIR